MALQKRSGKPTRKQLFLAALNIADLTQEQWAEDAGVTYFHLYLVLKGERESAPLVEKIDAFIAEQLAAATAA